MKIYTQEVTVYEASDGFKFTDIDYLSGCYGNQAKRKAEEYEENLKAIIDKTIFHKLVEGKIVYISRRNKIRTCRVVKVYEYVEEEYWDKEKEDYCTAKVSKVDLFDLTEENKDLADYTFTSEQIYNIKEKIEDLILPIVNYDN